jgi:phosphopantothenoylcysteine decarboxylase/phosphopantothenate--cysteine ligase
MLNNSQIAPYKGEKMDNKLKVLITAGGTQVPIDDVRFITNRSKGRFPWAIAMEMARRGHAVTVLGSLTLFETMPDDEKALIKHGFITFVSYSTYDELSAQLKSLISLGSQEQPAFDVLLMAAAVSDYGPANKAEGKLSSDFN